jgi:preprotein translocase subunit SecG
MNRNNEVKVKNSSNIEEAAGFARVLVQILTKLSIIAAVLSIIFGAIADRRNKKSQNLNEKK